jgi:putrescine aminotransferase
VLKLCRIASARAKKNRTRILSTLNSFHGKTAEAVHTGGKDIWQRWQRPLPDHTYVPYGDWIAAEEELRKEDVILFIAEPIQGEGGIVVPSDDYFPKMRELCDKYDAYFILDEIQSGSCRTGYLMAHKYYEGLHPDAFTFAKAISDGVLPVSGVQVKDSLYLAAYGDYDSAMMHTATYQDNNMSAAVALASLQYMLEHDVPALVRENSKYIRAGLEKLQAQYPDILSEVRGRGFMIGLQFGKDADGVGYANRIGQTLAEKYLIQTMTSINNDTILRAYPNIWSTQEDFDWFFDGLEKSFLAVEKK